MSKIRKVLFAITLFIIGALGIITAHFIEILFYGDMYVLSLISAITIILVFMILISLVGCRKNSYVEIEVDATIIKKETYLKLVSSKVFHTQFRFVIEYNLDDTQIIENIDVSHATYLRHNVGETIKYIITK